MAAGGEQKHFMQTHDAFARLFYYHHYYHCYKELKGRRQTQTGSQQDEGSNAPDNSVMFFNSAFFPTGRRLTEHHTQHC